MKSKYCALFLVGILALFTGCRSSKGFDVKIKSGPDVKPMVYGAVNDRVPFLQQNGFPNVKKPSGSYSVYGTPSVKNPKRLRNGEMQGFLRGNIFAEASAILMRYGIPLAVPTALHELTHTLLFKAGYNAESSAHDRRAFPDGGPYVLMIGDEPFFPGCSHSYDQLSPGEAQPLTIILEGSETPLSTGQQVRRLSVSPLGLESDIVIEPIPER